MAMVMTDPPKPKIIIFGTHPLQMNGYSQVVYHMAKELDANGSFSVVIYGFQNFIDGNIHGSARSLPDSVHVHDACQVERSKNNGQVPEMGFGFSGVAEFVAAQRPDVILVYNDMVVVQNVLAEIQKVPQDIRSKFKVAVYADQVYIGTRKQFVQMLNEQTDLVIAFTPYWLRVLTNQGVDKVPVGVLRHGFDPRTYYPIPQKLARKFLGIGENEFVILNINRNQPRKRWDTCLQAYAEFISMHMDEPIKLIMATTLTGGWNLMEIYEHELRKRGMTLDQGMKFLVLLDKPQMLSDFDVNVLYNAADVGLNTCDGEGFGLCNFQQAGVGVPQVVPYIGGFKDMLSSDRAHLVNPVLTYHVDASRDGVGGEAFMCDFNDFVRGIESYYVDADLRKQHGQRCRSFITQNYKWDALGLRLAKMLQPLLPQRLPPPPPPATSIEPPIISKPQPKGNGKNTVKSKAKVISNVENAPKTPNGNRAAIKRLLKQKAQERTRHVS